MLGRRKFMQVISDTKIFCTAGATAGATAGWVVGSATAADTFNHTCPASQTASTLTIPINGLKPGSVITGMKVVGQIESAGNTATLDAAIRKLTVAAGANVDAAVGAITQVSVTADTAVAEEVTGLLEVAAEDESFYILLTATTAAATDIDLLGVLVYVTEATSVTTA